MKHYNIPIFVPHRGCPNDCVFCNQKKITGLETEITAADIEKTVEEYLKTLPKNDRAVEIAFFGGSFTGIDYDIQGQFLSTVQKYIRSGDVNGIRLSTRPDYIDDKILRQLKRFGVTTIELGVQSLDKEVLEKSNRGHDAKAVYDAVKLIKRYDFSLGLQMMTGLPGDTKKKSIKTAKKIISLKPDFVRIYPTLVLKDTMLARMLENGSYAPQTLDEAVSVCKKLLVLFEKSDIPVIRMALQTTDEISPDGSILSGPYHAQFRELVEAEIYLDKFKKKLKNKKNENVVASVNPRELSKAVGIRKNNIKKLKEELNINLKIVGDESIAVGDFYIKDMRKAR